MRQFLLTFFLCLFALPAPLFAEPATLRFTSAYTERHPGYTDGFLPWIEQLQASGIATIRYFNPNTLCPEAGMFEAVKQGVVDIAANAHGRSPGRFPLAGVLDLPLLVPDAVTGSRLMQSLYEESPALQKESQGIQMLWHYTSAPQLLHTSKKPIHSLADLKGLKIIAWAPLSVKVLEALGAQPIQAVPHESSLALQRGMADGVLCPLSAVRSFKIDEAIRYSVDMPLMVDAFWVGMSPQAFKRLGPDKQAALMESVATMPEAMGRALDTSHGTEKAALLQSGHTFTTPVDEENWKAALMPLHESWIQRMEAEGHPAARELWAKIVEGE